MTLENEPNVRPMLMIKDPDECWQQTTDAPPSKT